MPETLQLKNMPAELAERIRRRAALYQRTPEEEATILLQTALSPRQKINTKQLLARVRAAGILTEEEAARMIREDRDER